MNDAHARLGVSPRATPGQIKQAYRRAVQRWHPDRHPDDPAAQDRFLGIQLAYRFLIENSTGPSSEASSPVPQPASVPQVVRGDDARIRVRLPLASVFHAQDGYIRVRLAQACNRCPSSSRRCPVCHGTGQMFLWHTLPLHVPAGVFPGLRWRLPGWGHGGQLFTERGDLVVEIAWRRCFPWRYRTGRLERRAWLPRRLRRAGGVWRFRAPDGRWGSVQVPPMPRKQWLCVPGLGLPGPDGTREPVWIWVV